MAAAVLTARDIANRLHVPMSTAKKVILEMSGADEATEEQYENWWKSTAREPKSLTYEGVYFIQAESGGLIKIGIAQSFAHRLKGIQAMCPIPLRILATISLRNGLAARLRELELHRRFGHLREHGEWFRPEHELLAYIEEIKK